MIVRDHLPWLRIWPQVSRLLCLLLFDAGIALLYVFGGMTFLAVPSLPLGVIGSALSIFLAFRTSSAYDRWWEARILWGGLREVGRRAPYMHDGSMKTLREVVEFDNRGRNANPRPSPRLRPLRLSAAEIDALVAFLRTLDGHGYDDKGPRHLSRLAPG